MEEEYEILSHDKIEQLKKEAEKYKSNPFIKNATDEKLYSAVTELTKSIKKLTNIFEDVKLELIKESEQNSGPNAKMDKLLVQNKQIAHALVDFGEKLDDLSPNNASNNINNEEVFQPNLETQSNPDIDYKAWNYNQPQKPGVTQTQIPEQEQIKEKLEQPSFNQQNTNQPRNQSSNQPINNQFSQQPSTQQGFGQQSTPSNNQFAQQSISQQGFGQQPDFPKPNMPELRPITQREEPEKKKKILGFI